MNSETKKEFILKLKFVEANVEKVFDGIYVPGWDQALTWLGTIMHYPNLHNDDQDLCPSCGEDADQCDQDGGYTSQCR